MNCAHCGEPATSHCEHCDTPFCNEHGTAGGDQLVQEVGAVAFPSQCWRCGGFNADA